MTNQRERDAIEREISRRERELEWRGERARTVGEERREAGKEEEGWDDGRRGKKKGIEIFFGGWISKKKRERAM